MNQVSLFGSCLSISLPNSFIDASTIRPVPDHQEMWMNKESNEWIIIGIFNFIIFRTC